MTPCLRALLAQRERSAHHRPRRRLDRRHRRRRAPGGRRRSPRDRPQPERRCRRAGWASRTPASSWPTPPRAPTVLVFVDADVVLAPAGRRRLGRAAAHVGRRPALPVPENHAETAGERLVQPLLQWSLADVPAVAGDGALAAPVARGGRRAVAGDPRGGLRPSRRPRGRARPGTGGHRAGPCGQTRRRPDRPRGRLTAGDLPHVRVLARNSSRATPSRCGRRSARRSTAALVTALLLTLYVLPPCDSPHRTVVGAGRLSRSAVAGPRGERPGDRGPRAARRVRPSRVGTAVRVAARALLPAAAHDPLEGPARTWPASS